MDSLKVFVSSTFVDLQAERLAVDAALRHIRDARFVGMEHFGARSEGAVEISLAELDQCDIYVGIIGLRRGSGITEIEYRRALQRGMACLVYQRREPAAGGAVALEPPQRALRDEMRARHVVVDFDDPRELALRVIADLHRMLIERLIANSSSGAAGPLEGSIRNFMMEYSGSARAPAIFGGRKRELAMLDGWLDDAGGPPCAVVVAPAGRGKSALLVRWVQRQSGRKDVTPIFFPISIRFGTNLAAQAYASIAMQLAALHGEPVRAAADSATEVWRGLLVSYLMRPLPEGTRAVLVLDGADECGDWQLGQDLLPAVPPAGLKFLVSARYLTGDVDATAWLHRLGWPRPRQALTLELQPLTPSELVALLQGMSVSLEKLSERHDVVAELFRLSEGDPLLVKLYVADLWTMGDEAARLRPADLLKIEPGLDGYFRRWWDDQRALWGAQSPVQEPSVNDLLNTLACALGPLGNGELIALLPPESPLDLWALEDTMQVLRRFVVGDGRSQGYVFGHPRLGEYFFSRLQDAGRALRHEQRFVDWGLRCLREVAAGERSPGEVPSYVPQFLRRHMARVASPAAQVAVLISPTWKRVWEPLDGGSCDGFLTDVSEAQAVVSREAALMARAGRDSPLPAAELRAALYASSIATLAASTSVQLLMLLMVRGVWTAAQAIAHASRIPLQLQRCATLAWLGAVMDAAFQPLGWAALLLELRRLGEAEQGSVDWAELGARLQPETGYQESTAAFAARLAFVAQASRQLENESRDGVCRMLCALVRACPDPGLATAELLRRQPWIADAVVIEPDRQLRLRPAHAAADGASLDDPQAQVRLNVLQGLLAGPLPAPLRVHVVEASLKCALALALPMATGAAPGSARAALAIDQVLALAVWLPDEAAGLTRRVGRLMDGGQLDALQQITAACEQETRLQHLLALVEVSQGRAACGEAFAAFVSQPALAVDVALAALVQATPALERGTLASVLDVLATRSTPQALIIALDRVARARPQDGDEEALRRFPGWWALLSPAQQQAARAALEDGGRRDSFQTAPHDATEDAALATDLAVAVRRLAASDRMPALQDLQGLALPVAEQDPVADAQAHEVLLTLDAALAEQALAGRLTLWISPEMLVEALGQPQRDVLGRLSQLQRVARFVNPKSAQQAVALVLQQSEAWLERGRAEALALAVAACHPSLRPPAVDTLAQLTDAARGVWAQDAREGIGLCEMARHAPLPDSLRDAWLALALQEIGAGELSFAELAAPSESRVVGAAPRLAVLLDAARLTSPSAALIKAALGLALAEARDEPAEQAICQLLGHADRTPLPTLLGALLRGRPLAERPQAGRHLEAIKGAWAATGDAFWGALLEAASTLPSEVDRAGAVALFVACAPPAWRARSAALVSEIRGAAVRLTAITTLLPVLPVPERQRLMIEALSLLRSTSAGPEAVEAIVGVALLDAELPQELRDGLLAIVHAQSDSNARQRLFSRLAPLLSDGVLGDAVAALQRLDDALARIEALAGLMRCAAEGQREAAVQRLVLAVDAVESPLQRDVAVLRHASLLPPPARWPRLLACFAAARPLAPGVDAQALAQDMCRALQDAPAAVCQGVLDWLARVSLREPAALSEVLAPSLPPAMKWVFAVRHGGGADVWDRCLTPAAMAHASRRWPALAVQGQRLMKAVQRLRQERALLPAWDRSACTDLGHALARCKNSLEQAVALRDWALSEGAGVEELTAAMQCLDGIADPELRQDCLAHLAVVPSDTPLDVLEPWVAGLLPRVRCAWAWMKVEQWGLPAHPGVLTARTLRALQDEPDPSARACAAARWACLHPSEIHSVLPLLIVPRPDPAVVDLLCELLPALPDTAAAAVVQGLHQVVDPLLRERMLCAADPLPGPATAAAVLDGVATLPDGAARAGVLCVLAPSLPEEVRSAAIKHLAKPYPDFAWLLVVQALAERWPALWNADVLSRALPMLPALVDVDDRQRWLRSALGSWPAEMAAAFIEAASSLASPGLRAELLATAAVQRLDLDATGVLRALRAGSDVFQRAVALGWVASAHDDAGLLAEALADAARAGGRQIEVEALACMARAAGRWPDMVLAAVLRLRAQRPAQVDAALAHLAQLLSPAQLARVEAASGGERREAWVAKQSPRRSPGSTPTPMLLHGSSAARPTQPAEADLAALAQAADDLCEAKKLLLAMLCRGPAMAPRLQPGQAVAPRRWEAFALIRRLQELKCDVDRLALLRQALVHSPGLRIDELLQDLRPPVLDQRSWARVADGLWARWLSQAPAAALKHRLAGCGQGQVLDRLGDVPLIELQPAREVLYAGWIGWLGAARVRDRATVLTELARMAPMLAALGDADLLLQTMDDVVTTAAIWP